MTEDTNDQLAVVKRTRKSHKKSLNGCKTCKSVSLTCLQAGI